MSKSGRRYDTGMGVGTLISLEEYLNTTYRPDCDFVEGHVLERNVGTRRHAYAQGRICVWFGSRSDQLRLEPLSELRMRIGKNRVRIPDVVVEEMPLREEEVFTSAPYLCIEVMSPEDTVSRLQERLDEYL